MHLHIKVALKDIIVSCIQCVETIQTMCKSICKIIIIKRLFISFPFSHNIIPSQFCTILISIHSGLFVWFNTSASTFPHDLPLNSVINYPFGIEEWWIPFLRQYITNGTTYSCILFIGSLIFLSNIWKAWRNYLRRILRIANMAIKSQIPLCIKSHIWNLRNNSQKFIEWTLWGHDLVKHIYMGRASLTLIQKPKFVFLLKDR